MALEFTKVSKPVIKRVVNPFYEVVAELDPNNENDARSFSVPNVTAEDKKAIRVLNRQLTEAGNEIEKPVTVRRNIVEDSKETTFTFWAVPKIVHNAETEAEEKAIEKAAEKASTVKRSQNVHK